MGFLGRSVVENPPANEGDAGSISGSGRAPGDGNGNPFQYSCLGNPIDRGAWRATVHGIAKRWTRLKVTEHAHEFHNQQSRGKMAQFQCFLISLV